MKRVVVPELLDLETTPAAAARASLRDLRRINRWFGGTRTTYRTLRRVADWRGLASMTVLDVGAATGDIAVATQRRLLANGIHTRFVLTDLRTAHLPSDMPAVAAQALALPFRDKCFDVVTSALLLHHLNPVEVTAFLREALRVCRHAVVVNDLRRSRAHLALVAAGWPIFSPVTRHDSLASVRRAYTEAELRTMLECVGARYEVRRFYLYRLGAILWK